MYSRYNIINHLISKFNYENYLEIGTRTGECFKQIQCKHKECVDIEKQYDGLTHLCSSDEFFKYNNRIYDIIFIDGNHEEEYVDKDVINSLNALKVGGAIVMHDCRPLQKSDLTPPGRYNGTVYKSFIKVKTCIDNIATCTVNKDEGCGIIIKLGEITGVKVNKLPDEYYDFDLFVKNRYSILNLIEYSELDNWLESIKR